MLDVTAAAKPTAPKAITIKILPMSWRSNISSTRGRP